jgi:predicted house-cleaning noncanonical NTP pyrophosphatase (MazG superfamily)
MPKYNKLVRDKIPKIIEEEGKKYKIKELDNNTYIKELKKKLEEEIDEYFQSNNNVESIEELADIVEVIHSLAMIHGKSFKDIEEIRQRKFDERGGFNEKLYLIEVLD